MSSRTAHVAVATVTALAVSLGAGLTVALLLAASPLSTRVSAFCCTAAALLTVCVIAGGPLFDRTERRRTRGARR
ncbi:hypothetical protein LN042_06690 [Kitasatospora sp. RB6PN24]|uniref:hypothetical protein n=1 Tax=Kitasatospora humi TaxID=2893891 RepID=UPI001E4AD3B0|nr:hypothetical protein [Kitasatospora humi]MCC9306794.1 hypothetical protein [Kitasatospora humi]